MSLYDDLGVGKDADKATIKRTYRKRVQKEHPDKGGSAEKFHAIQRAYDVLGDDERRAHYDATGQDGRVDEHGMLMQRIAALFMQFVERDDVDHTDIVSAMRVALAQGSVTTQNQIDQLKAKVEKYERAKKRVVKRGGGENILMQMLNGQIAMTLRAIELGGAEVRRVHTMIDMLKDYQYKHERLTPSQQRMMQWGNFGMSTTL